MTEKKADNPAWRLHEIIGRALSTKGGTVRNLWARAFETDVANMPVMFRKLALLDELVREVEESVRDDDSLDQEFFLENLPSLRSAIAETNFDRPSSEILPPLQKVYRDVGFWAHTIDSRVNAAAVDGEELRDLLSQVDELIEEIIHSDIDRPLKAAVLDALGGVRRAVMEYRLRGSQGLREELERAVGRLARHAADLKPLSSEPWYQRMWHFIEKADDAVSKGKKYLPLVKALAKLLPGGPHPLIGD